jgi:hypothetical protein
MYINLVLRPHPNILEPTMKKSVLLLAALALICSVAGVQAATATSGVQAATTTPAMHPKHNRMMDCAAAYRTKKLDKSLYKAFMTACLQQNTTPATAITVPTTPTATPAPAVVTKPVPAK